MEQKFICRYWDEEIAAERFSEPFGPDLLPGMYSTPVHAVPKPHSDDFHMVSNMSAGLLHTEPNDLSLQHSRARASTASIHYLGDSMVQAEGPC